MNVLIDIGVNLLVAFISFGLGWAWQRVREAMKLRGARRFWEPFVRDQIQIVITRTIQSKRREKYPEQIGRINAGTVNGLIEFSSYFRGLGVDNINVLYADRLQGDSLKSNLILVGSSASNAITEAALARIKSTFQFRNLPHLTHVLYDSVAEKFYETSFGDYLDGADLREVSVDHAMILKAANPFDEKKLLLIIAGNFAYGTWAGIRFVTSEEFIRNQMVSEGKFFEAVIEADILRGSPQRIKLVDLRELRLLL